MGCFSCAFPSHFGLHTKKTKSFFNPLTPELSQHAVARPGAPRHNIIFNSFFSRNFQANILFLREYIKDLQAGISVLREFVTVGEAGSLALLGEG